MGYHSQDDSPHKGNIAFSSLLENGFFKFKYKKQ